jgi:hypothetical protein
MHGESLSGKLNWADTQGNRVGNASKLSSAAGIRKWTETGAMLGQKVDVVPEISPFASAIRVRVDLGPTVPQNDFVRWEFE